MEIGIVAVAECHLECKENLILAVVPDTHFSAGCSTQMTTARRPELKMSAAINNENPLQFPIPSVR